MAVVQGKLLFHVVLNLKNEVPTIELTAFKL